tara:strand:+ start:2271 stop:3743 length:1473 start_codon:yes stop_codon:yes gene_type:complete
MRGVPLAMQQDGWWINGNTKADGPAQDSASKAPDIGRLALLIPLIALGDVLVWQVLPGLSLAVFGVAIVLAALWVAGKRISGQRFALVAGGSLLALLPLVELVQPLSLLIAFFGVSAVLALLAGLNPAELGRGAVRLWPMGVRQTVCDGADLLRHTDGNGFPALMQRLLMGWLVPVTLGLVFLLLLLEANPIAQGWADAAWRVDIKLPDGDRLVFWLSLVPLVWTALSLTKMRERLRGSPRVRKMGPARQGVINPASVTRALILFNAVFALQTAMDVIYLYGGVGLPEGITYAEYAHRGAYPLVITALLAGGFALLTRRWTDGNQMLRALLMFWVAQNVMLVVSSLVRLELYVEVFGLTHLRVAAAIWMGLVAGGLALILWQVWRGHCNGWLMLRCGVMGVAALYICALISFDAVIVRYNLSHPVQRDTYHLCWLGDAAQPIIAAHELEFGHDICQARHQIQAPRDWREWGFRNWRALSSLSAIQAEVAP